MKDSRTRFKTFAKFPRIHPLKLGRYPHFLAATIAVLPSMSFIPFAPFRLSDEAALGAGSELLFLVLEQDVERRERSVTARDVLLQFDLVPFTQFVARVYLLFENSQIIPDHHDFVEERLERDFF